MSTLLRQHMSIFTKCNANWGSLAYSGVTFLVILMTVHLYVQEFIIKSFFKMQRIKLMPFSLITICNLDDNITVNIILILSLIMIVILCPSETITILQIIQ